MAMARITALVLGFTIGSAALAPAMAQDVLDPNAPIGIEAGRFTLFPAVENTLSTGFGGTGPSVTVSPELLIQSNWVRHAAELLFDVDLSVEGALEAVLVDLGVTLDIGELWTVSLGASHQITVDDTRDPALPPGIDAAPGVRTTAADAALDGVVGNYVLRLDAAVVRTVHDDALVGGVPVDQSERDNTVFGATLRVERDVGALLSPFVEAGGGRRLYDVAVGSDGFLQAGNYADLRAGLTYDSAPVLTAEAAIGVHFEMPDDPALANEGALSADFNAVWSPREILVLTLATETAFAPNAGAAMGSSVSRTVAFDADWAVRETVTLTGEASWGRERFADGTIETATALGAGVVWSPSRRTQFALAFQQSWLASPDPLRDGSDTKITLTSRVTP